VAIRLKPWLSFSATAALTLSLSLSLTGCLSSKGIEPQNKLLDANALDAGTTIAQAKREAGWPAGEWWQAYQDPQLNQWINLALENSPSLDEALARVREAMAMADVTEADEKLQINYAGNSKIKHWPTDYFNGPGDLGNQTNFTSNHALGFSYVLDFWGREKNNSARSLNQAYASAAESRAVQLELERDIVASYVQLALLYNQLDITKNTYEQQKYILDLAKQRLAAKLGTEFEVSQASVPLPETHRQIDEYQTQIALIGNQIAALAGKGPGEAEKIKRPSLSLTAQPVLPAVLPADLIGRRPDVVARRWEVAAQARGIDVSKADFYPNINLIASLGFDMVGGRFLDAFSHQKLGASIGPAISLPIFDGGRLRSQLKVADAQFDQAVARYNRTLVESLRQVSDQLMEIHSREEQQHLAQQSVDAAQKSYEIADEAYRGGLTDYLNVLQSQTMLFQQQKVQQQVWAARIMAHANLMVALGGGLVASKEIPSDQHLQPNN
jgi:NodT family efflux transporter outer membrane factor (OMF) lipoprotein